MKNKKRIMKKEETEKRKKELRSYLKDKFTGILAREKWDMDDIRDVLDLVKELLKSEREKNRQRFEEILKKFEEEISIDGSLRYSTRSDIRNFLNN